MNNKEIILQSRAIEFAEEMYDLLVKISECETAGDLSKLCVLSCEVDALLGKIKGK